jgi:hypothetical protein
LLRTGGILALCGRCACYVLEGYWHSVGDVLATYWRDTGTLWEMCLLRRARFVPTAPESWQDFVLDEPRKHIGGGCWVTREGVRQGGVPAVRGHVQRYRSCGCCRCAARGRPLAPWLPHQALLPFSCPVVGLGVASPPLLCILLLCHDCVIAIPLFQATETLWGIDAWGNLQSFPLPWQSPP